MPINIPMAPNALDLASLASSIPVINSGCVVSNTPTKHWWFERGDREMKVMKRRAISDVSNTHRKQRRYSAPPSNTQAHSICCFQNKIIWGLNTIHLWDETPSVDCIVVIQIIHRPQRHAKVNAGACTNNVTHKM